jgi:ABC-2 type transport system permease protein
VRATFVILMKDLRLRVRDRSAFTIGIAAPLVLATILSQVVGDFGDGDFSATFGLVDDDRGQVSAQFIERIKTEVGQTSGFDFETDLSEAEARDQVDKGDLDAAIVFPAGFSDAVLSQAQVGLQVIGNKEDQLSAQIAGSIAQSIASRIDAANLTVRLVAPDGTPDPGTFFAALQEQPPVDLTQLQSDDRQLDTTTYLIAGLGTLFLFFLVQYGVTGLLEERQDGTMARLLAAPIHPLTVPLAKALVSVVLGLIGMATLAVVSTVALGAHWGDPAAAVVLIVAVVLAAVSVVGVVAGVARTAEQASNAQSVIALILGLLGGAFFPISRGEGLLTKLTLVTPHYWFLRGLGDGSAGGLSAAWGSVAALLLFAAVVGGAGTVLLLRGRWR